MAMSTERFLVTGAGGCIGAWAVRLLLDEGALVDLIEDIDGDGSKAAGSTIARIRPAQNWRSRGY